jgi:lysozyme
MSDSAILALVPAATVLMAELVDHYESCVLHPYPDASGIPTIGWGNTQYEDGTKVLLRDPVISQARANTLRDFWLGKFITDIAPSMPKATTNQLAAFSDLAYNIGIGAFRSSTAFRQFCLNNQRMAGASIELWNRAGNHVLLGLQRRRRAEHLVFNSVQPAVAIVQAERDFPS